MFGSNQRSGTLAKHADKHELATSGTLVEKAGKTYLQFVENQNDQEVRTTVKLEESDALIMRNGAVQMRLPFSLAKCDRVHTAAVRQLSISS